jgi:hypothetical protein
MKLAQREQAVTLLKDVEIAIRTLLPALQTAAYKDRWVDVSPAMRALNTLQDAVGEKPYFKGEKMQDTIDHDVKLIETIRAQRTDTVQDLDEVLSMARRAAQRLETRDAEVLQAQLYTEYWIDKANSLQEHLSESHEMEEDLLRQLQDAREVLGEQEEQ